MEKEYLLNEITNKINEFLIPFELTARMGTDWGYYDKDNHITWSPFEINGDCEEFVKFAGNEFGFIHKPCAFLLSLLHEVGHAETIDEFDQEEWDEYMDNLVKINQKSPSSQKNYEYFSLPIEYAATAWAVDYINNHWDECNNFMIKIFNLFNEFYETNIG